MIDIIILALIMVIGFIVGYGLAELLFGPR